MALFSLILRQSRELSETQDMVVASKQPTICRHIARWGLAGSGSTLLGTYDRRPAFSGFGEPGHKI